MSHNQNTVPFRINRRAMTVHVNGREVFLSLRQYRTLCMFLDAEGEMISYKEINRTFTGNKTYAGSDRQRRLNVCRVVWDLKNRLDGSGLTFTCMPAYGWRLDVPEESERQLWVVNDA